MNGQLPLQDSHPGSVTIARTDDNGYKVAFGNLTGDGNTDAAMATDCNAGGVPWSETVQLYTAGPTRLGGVDLGDLTHSREVVTDLSITDGVAHVTWLANGPNDAECCPTIKMAANLRWDGSNVSAQNVRRLNCHRLAKEHFSHEAPTGRTDGRTRFPARRGFRVGPFSVLVLTLGSVAPRAVSTCHKTTADPGARGQTETK